MPTAMFPYSVANAGAGPATTNTPPRRSTCFTPSTVTCRPTSDRTLQQVVQPLRVPHVQVKDDRILLGAVIHEDVDLVVQPLDANDLAVDGPVLVFHLLEQGLRGPIFVSAGFNVLGLAYRGSPCERNPRWAE